MTRFQDMPIFDTNDVEIKVGDVTVAYSYRPFPHVAEIHVPAGTVTVLTDHDVDYNDDTGRPEGYGPFVTVEYEDGSEDRLDCINTEMQGYDLDPHWVCEDVTIDVKARQTPREGA
jgi:hypothetical protein